MISFGQYECMYIYSYYLFKDKLIRILLYIPYSIYKHPDISTICEKRVQIIHTRYFKTPHNPILNNEPFKQYDIFDRFLFNIINDNQKLTETPKAEVFTNHKSKVMHVQIGYPNIGDCQEGHYRGVFRYIFVNNWRRINPRNPCGNVSDHGTEHHIFPSQGLACSLSL